MADESSFDVVDTLSDDDERAYESPDAYLDDSDDVFELEIDNDEAPVVPDNTSISQILRCRHLNDSASAAKISFPCSSPVRLATERVVSANYDSEAK